MLPKVTLAFPSEYRWSFKVLSSKHSKTRLPPTPTDLKNGMGLLPNILYKMNINADTKSSQSACLGNEVVAADPPCCSLAIIALASQLPYPKGGLSVDGQRALKFWPQPAQQMVAAGTGYTTVGKAGNSHSSLSLLCCC